MLPGDGVCRRGHPLTPENRIVRHGSPYVGCKACATERRKKRTCFYCNAKIHNGSIVCLPCGSRESRKREGKAYTVRCTCCTKRQPIALMFRDGVREPMCTECTANHVTDEDGHLWPGGSAYELARLALERSYPGVPVAKLDKVHIALAKEIHNRTSRLQLVIVPSGTVGSAILETRVA